MQSLTDIQTAIDSSQPSVGSVLGMFDDLPDDDETCLRAPLSIDESQSLHARMTQASFAHSVAPVVAPRLPHEDVLEVGGYVGKYQLCNTLGRGAFGLVFLAYDTELDREVALKVLNPAHLSNADVMHRFLQEARTTARISHPGIVTVLDFGNLVTKTGETTAFIAMERLHGESVAERLNRQGRILPHDAIEIGRQIASALEAAHRAEVLHRDLKPENVYLVADPAVPSGERVKVFDFGLAKLGRVGQTQVESIFGTPRYMSPEQWRSSAQIDARSDVYALGCVMFELVTGEPPFAGKLRELFEMHTNVVAPRARSLAADVPPQLDELIAAMLAKDPAHRPQSMAAVSRELRAMSTRATTASPFVELPAPRPLPPTPMPAAPIARPSMVPALVAFLIAIAFAAGVRWIAAAPPPLEGPHDRTMTDAADVLRR